MLSIAFRCSWLVIYERRGMFSYRSRSPAQILLHILDVVVEYDDIYVSVIQTLGHGVRAATATIDDGKDLPSDILESIAETEHEVIENLLGTAYVVCQAQITAVTMAALRVRTQALKEGLVFSGYGGKRHEVRSIGDPYDANYSKVEVLWALGNFFKHREEWGPAVWINPSGNEQYTIPALRAAGLQTSSTGNLRTGSEALGNTEYYEMTIFEVIVRQWADKVRERARAAFGQ